LPRKASLHYRMYRAAWAGLDLLFPPSCAGCGRLGTRWCADCNARVQLISGDLCEICGRPGIATSRCSECNKERPRYHALRSWAIYAEPVREAVLRLKYRRDVALGDLLAAQIVDFARSLNWPIDLLIPIPLGKSRLKERGYNQAALVARPLAMALGLAFEPEGLRRLRETRSQVGLTLPERRENVRAAFAGLESKVGGKAVLIIDDVATTGSTLSSSAEALYSSQAKEVYALTIARALPQQALANV